MVPEHVPDVPDLGGNIVLAFRGKRGGAAEQSSTKTTGLAPSAIFGSIEKLETNWFWSTDAEGQFTYLSDWAASLLTGEGNELLGREISAVLRLDESEEHLSLAYLLLKKRAFRAIHVRSQGDPDGHVWTVSGTPQLSEDGEFLGYAGIGTDVTDLQASAEHITKLASHDPLTGLRNRRGASALVNQAIANSARQGASFAILLVDLDRFKQINDTLGHPIGDLLLKQVADRLSRVVDALDCVARIGGDEFQIVLESGTEREALTIFADRVIQLLSQPYTIEGSRCVIGASIGIVIGPIEAATPDDLIRDADLALYAAKAAGRGRHKFFSQDMHEAAADRRLLEHDLLDAMEKGELELNYQPLVEAQTNTVTCFEALLRWNHPQRGRVSPALFIPIAEEANLIAKLGEWALRRACEDAATWPEPIRVAVNVSPLQFGNPNLPQVVLAALAHSGLPAQRLELEITESVFLGDTKEVGRTFTTLKKIGVRLALDDFGTGYSSLSYLKNAPFDKIKIDQSFVRGITDPHSRNAAIIASVVTLSQALGMDTTAEGVETMDQLELVRSLDVSHIQGYLYSLPVSQTTVAEKLSSGRWEIEPMGPAKQRQARVTTFRRIAAVHGNHCYPVILRNLSSTGALLEGLADVPEDTRLVIDFGDRWWSTATVRRSRETYLGVEFDEPLIEDGEGSYLPKYRVSALHAAGISLGPTSGAAETVYGMTAFPAFKTSLD